MSEVIDCKEGAERGSDNPGQPVEASAKPVVLESINEKLDLILSGLGISYSEEGKE